jgi:hypothetical protein
MPDFCSAGLKAGLRINVLTPGMSPGHSQRYELVARKHFEIRIWYKASCGNTLSRDNDEPPHACSNVAVFEQKQRSMQ